MAILCLVLAIVVTCVHVRLVLLGPHKVALLITSILLLVVFGLITFGLQNVMSAYQRGHVRTIATRASELCEEGTYPEIRRCMNDAVFRLDHGIDTFNVTRKLANDLDRAAKDYQGNKNQPTQSDKNEE